METRSRTARDTDTESRQYGKFIMFRRETRFHGRTPRSVRTSDPSRTEREPLLSDQQLKCGLASSGKRDNYATVSHKINRNVIRICGS